MCGALDEDRSKRRWLAGCLWLFYVIFYLCVLLIFNLIWDDAPTQVGAMCFSTGEVDGFNMVERFFARLCLWQHVCQDPLLAL